MQANPRISTQTQWSSSWQARKDDEFNQKESSNALELKQASQYAKRNGLMGKFASKLVHSLPLSAWNSANLTNNSTSGRDHGSPRGAITNSCMSLKANHSHGCSIDRGVHNHISLPLLLCQEYAHCLSFTRDAEHFDI